MRDTSKCLNNSVPVCFNSCRFQSIQGHEVVDVIELHFGSTCSSANASMGSMAIIVKTKMGKTISRDVEATDTIFEVKSKIQGQTGFPDLSELFALILAIYFVESDAATAVFSSAIAWVE